MEGRIPRTVNGNQIGSAFSGRAPPVVHLVETKVSYPRRAEELDHVIALLGGKPLSVALVADDVDRAWARAFPRGNAEPVDPDAFRADAHSQLDGALGVREGLFELVPEFSEC